MEDNSQLILTRSEKKLLMKILSSFLDKSGVETESIVIETILSKLKSKDKVVLYIDGAAMPDGQGAGIGVVCYKSERMILCYQKATNILSNFNSWTLIHIPREKNKEAAFLSKQGLQI